MDKARNPSNPKCYTPSSEPFRIYLLFLLFITGKSFPDDIRTSSHEGQMDKRLKSDP
jgi:hypothetical protein